MLRLPSVAPTYSKGNNLYTKDNTHNHSMYEGRTAAEPGITFGAAPVFT